jgi:hypothetical protein
MSNCLRSIALRGIALLYAILIGQFAAAGTLTMEGVAPTSEMLHFEIGTARAELALPGELEAAIELQTVDSSRYDARTSSLELIVPLTKLQKQVQVLSPTTRVLTVEIEVSPFTIRGESDQYYSTELSGGCLLWESDSHDMIWTSTPVYARWKVKDFSGEVSGEFPVATMRFRSAETLNRIAYGDLPNSAYFAGPTFNAILDAISESPVIINGVDFGRLSYGMQPNARFDGNVYQTVPEPSSAAIAGIGLAIVAVFSRRAQQRATS